MYQMKAKYVEDLSSFLDEKGNIDMDDIFQKVKEVMLPFILKIDSFLKMENI
ncbi:hypothetical protein PP175_28970 (plasmid) [Aneurinibacillus sp. Ricciae_BoGa-3]|uniref:hypothetical protein n=1 Tax=Aneurinibacillus sp. Ricciae_BoGa-3 TaxID=3022697 RepID=UPI002341476C|nr:hypothetical protein [Aneurinibacillus sp. Ricciae_BoGa-3]WCK57224.1 hypothetical protein PP175_28970 [Aneurinibacillus sp. Ricciae_BoGa-3]